MNHPLGKFHRPRHGAGLRDWVRGQTPPHRPPVGIGPAGQATFDEDLPRVARAAKAIPAPFVPAPPAKRPRLRWYQYSLRTLFLLTLIVSLLMSWYAVKLKKARAQKKAVDAILAAGDTVEYDYEFDEQGNEIKGAKGRGPAWLRELLGRDYFDTVVHVAVASVAGMDAVNGLVRLRSLSVLVPGDGEDPLKHLEDIDGLEELDINGSVTDAGLDRIRRLRHLRRLTLGGQESMGLYSMKGFGLAALQSCPTLRELIVQNYDLPPSALEQIETLSQLEKLTVSTINSGPSDPSLAFRINKLTALRELDLSNLMNRVDGSTLIIVGGLEEIQKLSQLEKLTLSPANLSSSDIQCLCKLPALRELDLTGCSKIDDDAVPHLQKMTGLRMLRLTGTGITDDGAERIDDALPNCRVIYGTEQ
jgi:hypothetical protein